MNLSIQKNIAILLGIGSFLFLVAAFLPYSRVFAEPSPEKKLAIIMNMRKLWNIGQILFGLGAIITAVAFGFLSFGLREITGIVGSRIGFFLMLAGALLWSWHVTERMINPAAFTSGNNTPYLFVVYSVFTQVGLVLLGILFVNSSIANWVGWMFIIGSALFFVLMVIFKDMPPFVYYLISIIASVVIYLKLL